MDAVGVVEEKADVFNRHNVDYILSGTGLAIDVAYRGLGNVHILEIAFWLKVLKTLGSSINLINLIVLISEMFNRFCY